MRAVKAGEDRSLVLVMNLGLVQAGDRGEDSIEDKLSSELEKCSSSETNCKDRKKSFIPPLLASRGLWRTSQIKQQKF